ncbi:hypothetical protein OHS59_43080 [Streptomyces sp. NBC_00414]|uniref:hypothetical protein n=1 Tax=Streptomyces sp. NBC_00414 TaxID=2975739 RepID=UPI002E1FB62C
MLEGVLVAESLRIGAELSGIPLQVTKIARIAVPTAAADQPRQWTLLHFTAPEADAERLAQRMAVCLAPTGGWYVDFHTAQETFVVFAGKVFPYPRGQAQGRQAAQAHGRSIGIPEPQLDWQL